MHKNIRGEEVITNEGIAAMSNKELSRAIKRINRWRRGEREFKWSEDPQKNKPCPYTPETIGRIFDSVAKRLVEK